MSPATLESIGNHLLVPGTVALWIALIAGAPAVRRSASRRRMLIAIASLATSITIYLDPVAGLLDRALRLGTSCGIVMNVWGVISSALILDFVLAATARRRPLLVYGGAVAVSGALLLLNTGASATACITSMDAPWFSLFWWLLCLAHVLGTGPSAVLCARYARQARTRPLRAGLFVLTTGFASSTVFWGLLGPGYLVARSPWLGAAFPVNIGITAWVMALGTALPQVLRLHRAAGDRRTLRRLEPLWRRLMASVPHVHLPEPEDGHWAGDLRLYRRVIEIRDAVLILRGYVGPGTIAAARAHVRGRAGAEALATACWLPLAEAAKEHGAAPRAAALADDESGEEWADEVGFALTLAEHQDSLVERRPAQPHLPPEAGGQEPGGDEPVERPERAAQESGQELQVDDAEQIFADRVVDRDLLERGVPVSLEGRPVGRPHLLLDLQCGAQHGAVPVDLLGPVPVQRADERLVDGLETAVQARGDPQLQPGVESVVGHRTGVGGADPPVRDVDGPAVGRAFLVGAQCDHGQVGHRGPATFGRMPEQVATVHPALAHAVADAGAGELHDHVRAAGKEAGPDDRVAEAGRLPAYLGRPEPRETPPVVQLTPVTLGARSRSTGDPTQLTQVRRWWAWHRHRVRRTAASLGSTGGPG